MHAGAVRYRTIWEHENAYSTDAMSRLVSDPSVEGSGLSYDYFTTPSVAGEEGRLDAPTPVPWEGSQRFGRLSRSISVASFGQHSQDLAFVQWSDWDSDAVYDEVPSTWISYYVDWKLYVGKRMISRGTEQNVVLEPTSYGPRILYARLDEILQRKIAAPRTVEADETEVVVSVTQRSEYDFVQPYEGRNVDWSAIQERLLGWGEFFKKGKKLQVKICFRYKESTDSVAMDNAPSKPVRKSATQNMLGELASHSSAEHAATGEPPAWRDIYALFRCPGPPCKFQPWCWYDSITGRRYTLRVHHIKILIRHRQNGPLETHDQVPEEFRNLIYEEEKQSSHKKPPEGIASSSRVAPIQITNVLPSQTSAEPRMEAKTRARTIDIPGLRDVNIQDYCDWQKSQVSNNAWKAEFQKATDYMVANYMDLELLHEDQNLRLLVDEGQVHENIAKQYIRDIEVYGVKRRKLDQSGSS